MISIVVVLLMGPALTAQISSHSRIWFPGGALSLHADFIIYFWHIGKKNIFLFLNDYVPVSQANWCLWLNDWQVVGWVGMQCVWRNLWNLWDVQLISCLTYVWNDDYEKRHRSHISTLVTISQYKAYLPHITRVWIY